MCTRPNQHGISLIELIMFIVIVSVALAGILLVMNVATKSSADPLVHKQALAIAESLLEEVELQPFTYCDPDDANAASAASPTVGGAGCAATVEGPGPETIGGVKEDRYGGANPAAVNAFFDNVNDYGGATWGVQGFTMNAGINDITNTTYAKLSGYSASVAVTPQAIAGIAALDGYGTPQVLLITVTVTGPDGVPVVLEGIRTRYAPNSLP
jgi:MSHA pilin protein MshD